MRIIITLSSMLLLLTIAAVGAPPQVGMVNTNISAATARTMIAKDTNVIVLDVRSPREYNDERIGNTPLMPLQFLEKKINELERYKKKKIIVYCHSGNRSELAVEILREYGFNALNMEGGILQWKANRFPTISGGVR